MSQEAALTTAHWPAAQEAGAAASSDNAAQLLRVIAAAAAEFPADQVGKRLPAGVQEVGGD